ncbi:uncharacterized protein LOC108114869 [Drosophila eugracilis]|uniref:uncharacterized protein LOC108114869 n=1 Tax=Drosophila eugracilis TaxID=29029 RepID=UPI001BD9A7CF|nr:uncharacterized protein LOC108114869 [Drosophila eugracilis]
MLPLQLVIVGCLFIAQGLCHTLPEVKVRVPRDTSNIPLHLFKPVEKKSSNEPSSNRGSLNRGNGTAFGDSNSGPKFFERSDGEVDEVNASYEDEEESDQSNQFQPQPFYPQNTPRPNGFRIPQSNFGNTFQSDYSTGPSGSSFSNRPFSSSPDFRRRNIVPFREPPFRNQNSGTWVSGPVPLSSGSMIPLISGGPSNPFGRSGHSGPIGPGSSSDNFYRSESYSYSSDGRGPPQIEGNVFDTRDGFGSSFRNF